MIRKYLHRHIARLVFVFGASAVPGMGAAIVIPVTNGSFEEPDVLNLTNGGPTDQLAVGGVQMAWMYTSQIAAQGPHYYGPAAVNDAIPYWTVTTTNNDALVYGVSDPDSTRFYGTSGGVGGVYNLQTNTDYTFNSLASISTAYGYQYADGYQTAFANLASGGSVSMVYNPNDYNSGDPLGTGASLGHFVAGDSYTLSIGVGTQLDQSIFNYSLILLDNGSPVMSSSGTSPATASGDWLQASLSYTAVDTGAIGIELVASDPYTSQTLANFDNVSFANLGAAGAPIIPEPACLGLLGLGVLALPRGRRA